MGTVQRPEVPPSPTTHRAGVMQDGPSAVSHDAPSIASSLQVPVVNALPARDAGRGVAGPRLAPQGE